MADSMEGGGRDPSAAFDSKAFDAKMEAYLGSNADKFYTDWEESFESFDQMGLHENLLRGIYAYGE